MILVSCFFEHDFNWSVNNRAIYDVNHLNQYDFKDVSPWSFLNYFTIILMQLVLKHVQIAELHRNRLNV